MPRRRSRSTRAIGAAAFGEKLFKRILRAATNHGVETIEIVCLPENVGMQNLAKKFDAHFTFEANSLTGRLTARRPTALSLIREASGDALDFGAALFDAHWRAAAEAREKGGVTRFERRRRIWYPAPPVPRRR